MPPKTSPEETTKTRPKKADKSGINKIIEEAPLFAGLDDYIQRQIKRENAEKPKADKVVKKKKAVAGQTKQAKLSRTKPQSAQKAKKVQPLDPNAILLSVAEMCKLLKISRATLVRMDKSGKLPGRIKMGGSVRFHRQTVDSWLQSLMSPMTPNPDDTEPNNPIL